MSAAKGVASRSQPWDIPGQWAWATMGEVADVIGGGTPRTSDGRNFEGGTIPWITPADLSGYSGKYIGHGARNITQAGLQSCGARMMPAGSVLFSSRAPIGYVAVAANALCTNQGFKSFVLHHGLLSDFVYYYLKRARDLAVGLAGGTTFLEISGASAARIPIPIPPLEEQRAIVEEIEKQFTRLDNAVGALKRVRANLKRYRASVLKAACEGRLVPTEAELARKEARSYETGEQLLQRILKERRGGSEVERHRKSPGVSKKKELRATAPRLDGGLPTGWAWVTLDQMILFGPQNGLYKPASAYGSGTPIVRIEDYQDDWQNIVRRLKRLRLNASEEDTYRLEAGDMLINRVNSPTHLGKCTVVGSEFAGSVFESNMMRLRFAADALPKWVEVCLKEREGRARLITNAKWAVNQASINQQDVRLCFIPMPPVNEQLRIVSEVERRLSTSVAFNQITFQLSKVERLRQAILRDAFAGRLL